MSLPQESVPSINGKSRGSGEGSKHELRSKFQLDLPKLQSLPAEQRDLYLFTFTVELERYVQDLGHEEICERQAAINQELLQIICLPTPAPSGIIRKSLGRCFAYVLEKGDRKTLYDSINRLISVIDARKSDKELQNKYAAAHCLGAIYKAAGDSAISLCSLSCSSLMRLAKPAQDHTGLRAGIFKAFGNIVEGVRGTIDESIAREIWKYARTTASGDKSAMVQASACKCLEQLIRFTSYFDTTGHFENLRATIWKTCDSSIPVARHAAASCLASILVKSYSDNAPEKSNFKAKKAKKPTRAQSTAMEEGEESISRPGSPSTKRNASKLEFTLQDLFKQLSTHYVRPSTSNKARAAITHCYIKILGSLNPKLVESAYAQIADHLLVEILSNNFVTHDRHRLLLTRKYVQKILADCLGLKTLGEIGRINAARILINDVLKNYPQVIKERMEPSKHTIIGALDVLGSLISSLGSAFSIMGDSCRESLIQVLQHPSYSVQIHASHCLRVFVQACPQQLLPCASICMNSVNRELGVLASGRHSSRRCIGFANGLAAVLSISPLQPLYSSLEISSRVLSIATSLLKSSSKAELRVSVTQVQVAWIFIGGLMSLGPNFVKIHISQLLLLWRNALPRPLTTENSAQRQSSEIIYLTHVRECALGSILSFLEFNNKLITTDVSKRIATMLQNTLEFLETLPTKKNDETTQRNNSSLQLQDLILMVRRRVLQGYTKLIGFSPLASSEILTQSNLVTLAASLFADPENYTPGSLGSSIANSAGNFESIWDIADNSGFGISGLIRGPIIESLSMENNTPYRPKSLARGGESSDIDEALLCPIHGAREHDSVYIHVQIQGGAEQLPDPPATQVVNSAIMLFATALPLQSPKVQEGVLEQLATFLSSNSLHRNPGRKAAVTANIAIAILGAIKVAVRETSAGPGDLRHPSVEKYLQEILQGLIVNQDRYIRNVAYAALGRLCNNSGNTFTSNEINTLIDMIVSNRDPNARAGCAMALGSIHSHVGGMAAGYHLKKIYGILMSLCSDPHPAVHSCAIEALSQVADSAGLTFSGYVSSTLGLLAQLWTCDTHHEDSSTISTSNYELESPTPVVIARCIDSLINVLGPDLQDMTKARELILTLIWQFEINELPMVQAEGLRATEHMYLYDSRHVKFPSYVRQLQIKLESPHGLISEIAVDGLYNLIRRDARQVFEDAKNGLEDQIWVLLNETPEQEGLHNIVQAWLGQTSLTETSQWVMRCQHILTKTITKQEDILSPVAVKAAVVPDLLDEEVAGFASSDGKDRNSTAAPDSGQELLSWQVRAFALNCLSDVVASVGRDMELDAESVAGHALQQRIADIIRMAFLASTSSVVELCVGGLRLIDQILTIFGAMPDPDFSEALLLEQYQAQISSALAPAFGPESSPDLASAAVKVCATFIATGLVTDVDRMGRILKLLVSSLDSFTDDVQDTAVGDLRGLSSNAQTMVRMAVLSAWAELQVASREQKYLVKVMEPHIARLTPLWLSSLQEFARLRFEPDISSNAGPSRADENLDTTYAALNRQTLLKFYQDSWLKLVDAIASLIDQDSNFVFDALDGKTDETKVNCPEARNNNINYRDEPVAFFFVLFGISIEALATRPNTDPSKTEPQTLGILSALKKILRPSVSGNAVFQDAVFSETIELFDRLALTEGLEVRLIIVDIVRNLCLTHPSAKEDEEDGDHLNDDIEQLFELTRIIVLVLATVLPNLAEQIPSIRPQLPDEAVSLIRVSLEALVDASDIFPSVIKTDLHASILHIFATVLGTGACQPVVVPQALPILRRFLQTLTSHSSSSIPPSSTTASQLLGFHHRLISILATAQRRESDYALPCAKNTLLALTILLTTSSRFFPPIHPLLSTTLDAIIDCLQDLGLAKVAAGCLRSLLVINPKSPLDEATARYLFPRLLRYLLASTEPDPENAKSLIASALVAFVTFIPSPSSPTSPSSSSTSSSEQETLTPPRPFPRMSAALSVLVPALLTRAAAHGKPLFQETAQLLLQLVSADQRAFRGVVARMDGATRAFMEGVLREGGVGAGAPGGRKGDDRDGAGGEPSIALKLSFGVS